MVRRRGLCYPTTQVAQRGTRAHTLKHRGSSETWNGERSHILWFGTIRPTEVLPQWAYWRLCENLTLLPEEAKTARCVSQWVIVIAAGLSKNKWPRPKVGGRDEASEFLEADELNPIHRQRYILGSLRAAGLSDWAKVNTENGDKNWFFYCPIKPPGKTARWLPKLRP